MTNDHHEERVAELIANWAEFQIGLIKLLLELPVPISIPGLGPDLIKTSLDATAHAARIVYDQPITPRAADMIAQAITFWLSAYDLIRAFDTEPTPWREAAASLALQQTAALCILALEEMHGKLPE